MNVSVRLIESGKEYIFFESRIEIDSRREISSLERRHFLFASTICFVCFFFHIDLTLARTTEPSDADFNSCGVNARPFFRIQFNEMLFSSFVLQLHSVNGTDFFAGIRFLYHSLSFSLTFICSIRVWSNRNKAEFNWINWLSSVMDIRFVSSAFRRDCFVRQNVNSRF